MLICILYVSSSAFLCQACVIDDYLLIPVEKMAHYIILNMFYKALDVLRKALKKDPGNEKVQEQISSIEREIAAMRSFKQTRSRRSHAPEQSVPTGTDFVEECLERSRNAFDAGDEVRALQELEREFREAQRDRAMLYLMLSAGLRVSEVSDARLDDLTLKDGSGSIAVRGREDKVRIVPLNASARRALGGWLEVRPAIDDDHVFLGKRRTYLRPDGIFKRVRHYAQMAGIEDVSPQTLRHTCGKNLADQGVSLDRVAAILGHEDLNTTKVYTLPSQSDLAREVEKIAWEKEE